MSPFDTFFVAFVVAAFSLYGLILFTAWLLVTVRPSKAAAASAPIPAERPIPDKLAA